MAKPPDKVGSTPLANILRLSTDEQRTFLATTAGTTVNYLYSLAGCHREKLSAQLAFAIEDASQLLHDQTGGDIPVVTARQLTSMCSLRGMDDIDV
jgi:hypothetical protein